MNSGRGNIQRSKGFTLLEVLVAFSLLSVSLGVIMLGISKSLRVSDVTREYSRAITLAESRLAEYSEIDLSRDSQVSGRFDNRYDWSVEIEPYHTSGEPIKGGNIIAYRVTARVIWPGRNNQREIILSTLRLGPPSL